MDSGGSWSRSASGFRASASSLTERSTPLADRPLRTALVLGGTGFMGVPLVRRLVAAGVRTSCLVHRTPVPVPGAGVVHGSLDRFPWHTIEREAPDVIFHLARIPGRGGIRGAVTRLRNRLANERLVLALTSWAKPPLVIYVGGTLAYGNRGEEPVTERTAVAPTSFSRDYYRAELPWARAVRGSDVPVIIARPAWVLGPGSWFEVYYRRFMRDERAVPLYGTGDNWMSLIHVDDCAGLFEHAARHALPMSVINLFGGPPLRQAELAERLSAVAGLPIRRVPFEDLERRYGRAVREAFTFSARIGTVHQDLHGAYRFQHQDLDAALASVLRST